MRLAEFTSGRKDPGYVDRAKEVQKLYNISKKNSIDNLPAEIKHLFEIIAAKINSLVDMHHLAKTTGIGNLVCAVDSSHGSAREQAVSCQKILGTWANLAYEYANKRYRSNCINWGILPLLTGEEISSLSLNSYISPRYLDGDSKRIGSGKCMGH